MREHDDDRQQRTRLVCRWLVRRRFHRAASTSASPRGRVVHTTTTRNRRATEPRGLRGRVFVRRKRQRLAREVAVTEAAARVEPRLRVERQQPLDEPTSRGNVADEE